MARREAESEWGRNGVGVSRDAELGSWLGVAGSEVERVWGRQTMSMLLP